MRKLDDDEKFQVVDSATLYSIQGGENQGLIPQAINLVNESGLYTLILRCRDATKPGTLPHRFRKWVTSEVLPAIRKTGRYEAQPDPSVYPRCTKEQLAKLTEAVQRSLYHWMFNPQATQHVYNRLRVDHHIKHIADLPAADFERALARVAEIASMNGAFASWIDEAKQAFLTGVRRSRRPLDALAGSQVEGADGGRPAGPARLAGRAEEAGTLCGLTNMPSTAAPCTVIPFPLPPGGAARAEASVRAAAYRQGVRDWCRGYRARNQPPGYLEGWYSTPGLGFFVFEP